MTDEIRRSAFALRRFSTIARGSRSAARRRRTRTPCRKRNRPDRPRLATTRTALGGRSAPADRKHQHDHRRRGHQDGSRRMVTPGQAASCSHGLSPSLQARVYQPGRTPPKARTSNPVKGLPAFEARPGDPRYPRGDIADNPSTAPRTSRSGHPQAGLALRPDDVRPVRAMFRTTLPSQGVLPHTPSTGAA